jgi:hypothetical protein
MFYPFSSGDPFVVRDNPPSPTLTVIAAQPPGANSVMYVAKGCWGCEGNDAGLQRVVTGASGGVAVEAVPVPDLNPGEGAIWYTASSDGTLIVAVTCSGGNCGPLGQAKGDEHSRLLGSTDGGYTWEQLASDDGFLSPTVGPRDRLLVSHSDGSATATWSLLNPAGDVQRPTNVPADAWPQFLADGTVGWLDRTTSQLFRADGTSYFKSPVATPDNQFGGIWDLGRTVLVGWYKNGVQGAYLGLFEPNGTSIWQYELPPEAPAIYINSTSPFVVANTQLTAPGIYSAIPALFDPTTATLRLIGDPFGVTLQGRNRFLAYITGPFLRVTGAGDCLNVRAEPSATAAVLRCYRDGVLFVDNDETKQDGTTTWRSVHTPDGHDGWASAQYLAPLP